MNTEITMMLNLLNCVCNAQSSDFEACGFDSLHEGDIVLSMTMTHSQKYVFKEGYEDYNMVKHGILLYKNMDDPEKSVLFRYDSETKSFTMTNLYKNPGSSGSFVLKKLKIA